MDWNLGSRPPKMQAPFPAWDKRAIMLVEQAILISWNSLMASSEHRRDVAAGSEVQVTVMLTDALELLLNSGSLRGFSPAVFAPPIRGQELEDCSGERREKRPDLTFLRYSSVPASSLNGLFFECKLLGRGRTLGKYVNDGLARFLDGRYAWAMPHAGMLAYVQPDEFCGGALHELQHFWDSHPQPVPCKPARRTEVDAKSIAPVAISTHARPFRLRNGLPAGQIVIRHLWLAAQS